MPPTPSYAPGPEATTLLPRPTDCGKRIVIEKTEGRRNKRQHCPTSQDETPVTPLNETEVPTR